MKKLILVAVAILMMMPAATVMAQHGGGGHGGGGSHGGGSHGGGSHGGGSHGGGSHGGGGWHDGGWHGGFRGGFGGWHGGGGFYYPPIYADPYWGPGFGWGWGFGPYGFYGYYGPYSSYGWRSGYGNNSDWAVVDTDVSPEESRVFLDGRYIGLADDFDGHPDYLYLRPGNYSLEFRLPGYESATVSVNARPGAKINLGNKLKKIPGAKEYGSYDTPQPEGGLQRYFGKKSDGTDEAMDRSRRYRDGNGVGPNSEPGEVEATPDEMRQPPPPPRKGVDLREDEWRQSRPRHGARLLLVIAPADAAVYLDDRFIGTGDEVGGPDQAVPLSAGKHSVTVSRPGYKDKTVEVDVLAGEVKRVDVSLEK